MNNEVAIGELFTDENISNALALFESGSDALHERLLHEIVEPAMPHINKVTGQNNSADYMAYLLEYAVLEARNRAIKGALCL
jgi:hypothetical protein